MSPLVSALTRRRWLAGMACLAGGQAAALAQAPAGAANDPAATLPSDPLSATTRATAGAALCIGRFSIVLPEGWVVAGREQKLYFSRVTDDLRPRGRVVPGESATLRILRGELPLSDPLLRELTLDGVGPAAWFGLGTARGPNQRLVVLAGRPGVRIETLASVGREDQAEKALRQLAAGYRAGGRTGFCLPHGAMILQPSRNESTHLAATHMRIPGAELRFSTLVMTTPRSDGPVDLDAAAQAMAGSGTTLKPLGNRAYQVAGLKGRAAYAELQEPAKPKALCYRFFFAGLPGSASAPELTVTLAGPAVAKTTLEAAWQQLLDSVRPVPLR